MKFFCRKSDLNKALGSVSHSVPARSTTKILEGILVEITGGIMSLTASDTSMTIVSTIAADSDEDVSFVVIAKIFSSYVSKLPEEEVMFDYDAAKKNLKIRSGGSDLELVCYDADEYPKISVGEGQKIILSKNTVKNLIRKTAFSASTNELNGVLTGVLVQLKDRKLRMVAVDSFRMAIYDAAVDVDDDVSVIIPANMLLEVSKMISDDGEDTDFVMEILEKKIVFYFDNNKVIVNTLAGKFLDYTRIISGEKDIHIRFKTRELMNSVDRAMLMTNAADNNLIKLTVTDDLIDITSLSEQGTIDEKVEVIKEGDDLSIGFNGKYLMDILKVIDDEEVMMYIKDNVSPCIIRPLSGDTYLYLVLPVRLG
jgi:DNA polymerase-3 subunit beta